MQFGVQPHQISVNRLWLLPLFEYHYSHLVSHPRAEIISQPSLHAADSEVVYPASQYLVQLHEGDPQRHCCRPFPAYMQHGNTVRCAFYRGERYMNVYTIGGGIQCVV